MKKLYGLLLVVSFLQLNASQQLIDALELASLLPRAGDARLAKGQEIQELLKKMPGADGVIRIPVLQQGFDEDWPSGLIDSPALTWEVVKNADGANCGYHALKNVILLMNTFEKSNEKYLDGLDSKRLYFNFMRIWTPIIYAYRKHRGGINWLFGQEIELLLSGELSRSYLADLSNVAGIPKQLTDRLNVLKQNFLARDITLYQNIVVIESLAPEDARRVGGFSIDEKMLEPIKNLARQANGTVGVVWTQNNGGHWVGFVIHKQHQIIKVYYMNSCRGDYGIELAVPLFYEHLGQAVIAPPLSQTGVKPSGKDDGATIYPNFIGCIERDAPMNQKFTKQELATAGFTKNMSDFKLDTINTVLESYVWHQIEKAVDKNRYRRNIEVKKKRLYGFWTDPKQHVFIWDLGPMSCKVFKEKHKKPALSVDLNGDPSFRG